jgi:hypothetical protein
MRMMLFLLMLVLTPLGADAQTPRIDRIDVVDYGIYTVQEQNCKRDEQGIQRCDRADVRHAVTTLKVPAQPGIQFGMRYRVVGAPVGAPVTIKRVWLLPAPGFVQPGKEPIHRLERADATTVGATLLAQYGFDDPWELIPGAWTQEFWNGDRKLLTRTFTVVKP